MRPHTKKTLILLLPLFIYVPGCVALSETPELQQLRADYNNLQLLKAEFNQSQKNGELSNSEAVDYKAWIGQLQNQVANDCQALAGSSAVLPTDPPCEKILAASGRPASINIKSESTEAEKTKRMIEQLNGSLGEFDERLLTEQDRVKSRAPRTNSAGGGSSGNGGEEDETAQGEKGKKEQAGKETGKDRQTSSRETGTPTQATSSKKSTAPKDIPDGRNDDVIARQLREAAEKENDPKLRKKLWDEYRRYKSGSLK